MGDARSEIAATLERLREALDALAIRGLRSAGDRQAAELDAASTELRRVGSELLGGHFASLANAVRSGAADCPRQLFTTQTALRVFERVFTLGAVSAQLSAALQAEGADEAVDLPPQSPPAASAPAPVASLDPKALAVLDDLLSAVEELVSTGLTTTSQATRERLDVAFKEAARLKLSRLAASLRYVNEELGRFLAEDAAFSAQRLSFFLNRSWLLARGLSQASQKGDGATLSHLLLSGTAPTPIPSIELVVLGVAKRAVKGSCSFDFRMRALESAGPVKKDQPVVWSCLFVRPKDDIPAEAFLHLPQPQKFLPKDLMAGQSVTIKRAAATLEKGGGARLVLSPQSEVKVGKPFTGWERFRGWHPSQALERVQAHHPTPLDLEIELQQEVCLQQWSVGAPRPGRTAEQVVYPVAAHGLEMDAVATRGEGDLLRTALDGLARAPKRPPLFGTLHFELGRLVLQPLATLGDAGPTQLMISTEAIDTRALMGLLKF